MPGGGSGRCGRGGPVAGLESRRALRGSRFDSSIFRLMEDELGWSQARLLSGVRPTRSRGSTPPASATCTRTPWCDGRDPHRCPSSRSPPGLLSLRGRVRLSGGASHHRYPCPRPTRHTAREDQPTELVDSLAPSRGHEDAGLPSSRRSRGEPGGEDRPPRSRRSRGRWWRSSSQSPRCKRQGCQLD
jgi:hypothetical protein